MSLYVTLRSDSHHHEFPNNQAHWFKVRLPTPLRLTEAGWQVGLSSIVLPDSTVPFQHLVPKDEPLWEMSGYYIDYKGATQWKTYFMKMEHVTHPVVDGISFMTSLVRWFQKQFTEGFSFKYGYQALHQGKNTLPVLTWEGPDLLLDNQKVARTFLAGAGNFLPHVSINHHLAIKMGWFTYDQKQGYQLGPNLLMIFHDGKIPGKQEADWTDGDRNPEYYRTGKDKSGVTWILLTCVLAGNSSI